MEYNWREQNPRYDGTWQNELKSGSTVKMWYSKHFWKLLW